MTGWWDGFCRRWAALSALSVPGRGGRSDQLLMGGWWSVGSIGVSSARGEAEPVGVWRHNSVGFSCKFFTIIVAYFISDHKRLPMDVDPTSDEVDIVFVNHERCGKCAKMRNEYKNYGIKSLLGGSTPRLLRVPAGATPIFDESETLAEGRPEIRQFVEENIK